MVPWRQEITRKRFSWQESASQRPLCCKCAQATSAPVDNLVLERFSSSIQDCPRRKMNNPDSVIPKRGHCRPDAAMPVCQHLDAALKRPSPRLCPQRCQVSVLDLQTLLRALSPSHEPSQAPYAAHVPWLACIGSEDDAAERPCHRSAGRPGSTAATVTSR